MVWKSVQLPDTKASTFQCFFPSGLILLRVSLQVLAKHRLALQGEDIFDLLIISTLLH